MNPVYFGLSPKTLFGIYHPPARRSTVRDHCVVLCYPMAHEYLYVHRAFHQLAARLAKGGFPAFRFDYYGFGDSAGDSEESNIEQWRRDIAVAIDEVKSMSGLSRVSLIGLRLGATASALAAEDRNDVESVVLWEPVINGSEYIEELSVLHQNWMSENVPGNGHSALENGTDELIGMPFPQRMRSALQKVDLMKFQKRLARNVLALDNSRHPNLLAFKAVLNTFGDNFEYKHVDTPDSWDGGAGIDSIQVPGQTLNLIVSWMSGDRQ